MQLYSFAVNFFKLIFIYYCNLSKYTDWIIYIELYTLTYYVIESPEQWCPVHAAGCRFIWTDPVPVFTCLVWRPDPADVVISISHTLAWWQGRGSKPTPLTHKMRVLTPHEIVLYHRASESELRQSSKFMTRNSNLKVRSRTHHKLLFETAGVNGGPVKTPRDSAGQWC